MTRSMPFVKLLVAVATTVTVLAGCGGSGGSLGDDRLSLDGELTINDFDEDRYFDVYEFVADSTGEATVEMQSDDIDSYLIAYRQDGPLTFTELTKDDDSGDFRDAKVTFQITAGVRYRIVATAFSRQTGEYRLVFSRILGQPIQLVPTLANAAASVNAMTLPRAAEQKKSEQDK